VRSIASSRLHVETPLKLTPVALTTDVIRHVCDAQAIDVSLQSVETGELHARRRINDRLIRVCFNRIGVLLDAVAVAMENETSRHLGFPRVDWASWAVFVLPPESGWSGKEDMFDMEAVDSILDDFRGLKGEDDLLEVLGSNGDGFDAGAAEGLWATTLHPFLMVNINGSKVGDCGVYGTWRRSGARSDVGVADLCSDRGMHPQRYGFVQVSSTGLL
jgi:hypothetical protein